MGTVWLGVIGAIVLGIFAFVMGRKTAPQPKETKVLLGQFQQDKELEQYETSKKDLEEKHEKLAIAKEEWESSIEKEKTLIRNETKKVESSEDEVNNYLKQVGKDSRK